MWNRREARFVSTDFAKDASDELMELKQIKSAKGWSCIFTKVALNVTDLSPVESLDRYVRGLKKHVRAQVLLQKHTTFLLFGFSNKKLAKKPGTELPQAAHTFGNALEVHRQGVTQRHMIYDTVFVKNHAYDA